MCCYRIGNITIGYDGLPFHETDELAIFRTDTIADVDIRCTLRATANVALEGFDESVKAVHWKNELEGISSTPDCRKLYLTDRQKNVELLIEEMTEIDAVEERSRCDRKNHPDVNKEQASNYRRLHQAQLLDIYADQLGISTILRVLDLPFEVLRCGGVFLHASYIEWKGKAILFTAPKQTGKSTQAALWEKYNQAVVVNGDRALLLQVDGVWHAFGSPYCGTSHICKNRTLPIAAIVILGQAKENHLTRANTMQALQALLDGCTYETWDREQVVRVMDIAENLIKNIPFWKMECVPDESAVRLLEKVL